MPDSIEPDEAKPQDSIEYAFTKGIMREVLYKGGLPNTDVFVGVISKIPQVGKNAEARRAKAR